MCHAGRSEQTCTRRASSGCIRSFAGIERIRYQIWSQKFSGTPLNKSAYKISEIS